MAIPDLDAGADAPVYPPWVLRLCDGWELVSNRWAWRCPTEEVLLPFYRGHLGQRHLEVGVGTGWYLAHAGLRGGQQVALLDLDPHRLRTAAQRLDRSPAGLYAQDAMRPLDALAGQRYDSIALFYLLHCLPGGTAGKAAAIAHLAPLLDSGGTLYGATILGDGAGHNAFGRGLMAVYNRKGVFGNRHDTAEGVRAMLEAHFAMVEVRRHGAVALFTARGPLVG